MSWTGCGGGPRRGSRSGSTVLRSALLRGMVLGADERLTQEVKDDFQALGSRAHPGRERSERDAARGRWCWRPARSTGMPLRARLAFAAAVIALYVPLTGAGPVDPARGGDGRGRAGRGAGGAAVAALVRAAARRGGDARAQPARGRRSRGGSCRSPRSRRCSPASRRCAPRSRAACPEPVADAAALTVAATLGTAPLMALHFQEVSLAALPGEPAGGAGDRARDVAGRPGGHGGAGRGAARRAVRTPDRAAARLPPARRPITADRRSRSSRSRPARSQSWPAGPRCSTWSALALRRWSRTPRRRRRRLAPAALAALAALATAAAVHVSQARGAAPPPPGVLRITFLDIGQGDATLIELDGVTVLVDTGKPDGPILTRLQTGGRRPARRAHAHPRGERPRGRGARGHRAHTRRA